MKRTIAPTRTARRQTLRLSIHPLVGRTFVPFLRKHLKAAHHSLNPPLCELSLAIVDDVRMAALHQQFLQIPGTTDVLTFPLEVDDEQRPVSGEVVICLDEARRQSAERGKKLPEELLLYSLHGMLHLCGFDDKTKPAYRRMHATEDQILQELGIGPVFAADVPNRQRPRTEAATLTNRPRRRTPGAR